MARSEAIQLNVRSRFARDRAALIARATGMTTTQVVEEALRAYLPPAGTGAHKHLIRKGAILVKPAAGRQVSLEDANAMLDDIRDDRG